MRRKSKQALRRSRRHMSPCLLSYGFRFHIERGASPTERCFPKAFPPADLTCTGNTYDGHMSTDPRDETLVRPWTRYRVRFVLSVMLLFQSLGYAQAGPQPPCGKEPVPSYPRLDDSATVKSWSKSDFGGDWKPPACTGWAAVGFTTLVTIVARFRDTSKTEDLLRHIGAISDLPGMR